MEMKAAINSFQPKDMAELVQFQQHVEHLLEKLSDETKVLEKFDDFPLKKLETLRTAAALYSKLKAMLNILQTWKIEPPVGQLLDRVEKYLNKINKEVEALERSKDEESKRFRVYKIDFDFNILVQIKESMVDISSSCMELILKERREAKKSGEGNGRSKTDIKPQAYNKMLWRAFELAFQVCKFAGGQDDRAIGLSIELANEIEADTQHE
ncbi:Hydroxyproline-rich glycoprotein family protein [Thalictrum thalictroides]|uniref:Hydroxyproline-rich glycoprotein family protein n=1 Tax=Thalictrum thalictroides TaxID=46969 RepID=A0A7J6WHW0_THATH|nr:Hydroxyproline-rich glycoprotein family protein [Thalictrum thalictroides]